MTLPLPLLSRSMDVFFFPFPVLFIAALVIIILAMSSANRRRQITWPHEQACHNCHTNNPPHANFCRRCGRKLV